VQKIDEKRSLWQLIENKRQQLVCEYQIHDEKECTIILAAEDGDMKLNLIRFTKVDTGVQLTNVI
jgi:hypothetical protein